MKSIGILVAMNDELTPLRQAYTLEWTGPGNFFCGKNRGMRLQVALSGAGPQRAAEAMARLSRYGKPDVLVGLGLSGGLSPEVGLADVILASSVQSPGLPTLTAACELLSSDPGRLTRTGPLLTLPTVLTTRAEKAEVHSQYPECWAVDMETYSLAQAAHGLGLPWLALRAISDPWNRELPLDFNLFLDPQGQASLYPLLKSAARDLNVLGALIRFGQDVFRARRPLLEEFDRLLEVLSR